VPIAYRLRAASKSTGLYADVYAHSARDSTPRALLQFMPHAAAVVAFSKRKKA
jgi:hypothetical protein